jgi:methylmalonyl-CoA mutase N-terminal domain/subunit
MAIEPREKPEYKERKAEFSTMSGQPVAPLYGPEHAPAEPDETIGSPGEYPFTRGPYPSMYRGRLWTMRQFAGFGTVEETNERFHYLLDHGQTGLSTAFDMPTLMGYDSDHTRSLGEVGREGVAVDTLDDMEQLFDGIPLGGVTTSMTINAPAAILLAFYVLVGEQQGVPPEKLRSSPSRSRTASPTSSGRSSAASTSTISPPASPFSSTPTSTSSRRSPSTGRRAGSGPAR